jgi:hypothetical protein
MVSARFHFQQTFNIPFRNLSEKCFDPGARLERAGPCGDVPLVIIPRRLFTIHGTLVSFTSGRS